MAPVCLASPASRALGPQRAQREEDRDRSRRGDDHDREPGREVAAETDAVQPDEEQHGARRVPGDVDRPGRMDVQGDPGHVLAQQQRDVVGVAGGAQVLLLGGEEVVDTSQEVDQRESHEPAERAAQPGRRQRPPRQPRA